jgi:hypothetical protein
METENEQALANAGWSSVQVTVDSPIGNSVPETGAQAPLSTPIPATVGRPHVTATGNASTDGRSTEAGHDNRAAVGVPGVVGAGVGAVGESLPQPAARTARMSVVPQNRSYMISCGVVYRMMVGNRLTAGRRSVATRRRAAKRSNGSGRGCGKQRGAVRTSRMRCVAPKV